MKERSGCRPDGVLSNFINAILGTKPEPKQKLSKEAYAMMLKTETSQISPLSDGETVDPTGYDVSGKNGHKSCQPNKS